MHPHCHSRALHDPGFWYFNFLLNSREFNMLSFHFVENAVEGIMSPEIKMFQIELWYSLALLHKRNYCIAASKYNSLTRIKEACRGQLRYTTGREYTTSAEF